MVNHPRPSQDRKIAGRCDSITAKLAIGEYRLSPLEPAMKTLALLLLVATTAPTGTAPAAVLGKAGVGRHEAQGHAGCEQKWASATHEVSRLRARPEPSGDN